MLKIVANVSKKMPVPGVDYSSQSFSAGIEVEIADAATHEEIQDKVHDIYGLLERTIDSELASHKSGANLEAPKDYNTPNRISEYKTGNNNGNGRHATEAQVKAIFAIAKSVNMSRESLLDMVCREYHVNSVEELTLKSASNLIERLKALQNNPRI